MEEKSVLEFYNPGYKGKSIFTAEELKKGKRPLECEENEKNSKLGTVEERSEENKPK